MAVKNFYGAHPALPVHVAVSERVCGAAAAVEGRECFCVVQRSNAPEIVKIGRHCHWGIVLTAEAMGEGSNFEERCCQSSKTNLCGNHLTSKVHFPLQVTDGEASTARDTWYVKYKREWTPIWSSQFPTVVINPSISRPAPDRGLISSPSAAAQQKPLIGPPIPSWGKMEISWTPQEIDVELLGSIKWKRVPESLLKSESRKYLD